MSGGRLRYLPALDGVRALAVLAVLAYHGGQTWAAGGYLGVDAATRAEKIIRAGRAIVDAGRAA